MPPATPAFKMGMAPWAVLFANTATSPSRACLMPATKVCTFPLPRPHITHILLVSYYQPETAYNIFKRMMFNTDVATGQTPTANMSNYSTVGPSSSFQIKNQVPPPLSPMCYLWDILETCTPQLKAAVQNGSAIVKDFVVVGMQSANGTAELANGANTSTVGIEGLQTYGKACKSAQ